MEQNVVYNIGSGGISVKHQSELYDGWKEVMVDVADCNPDIVSDIVGLEGIEDECADSVWASHVVEHVYWHELPVVFNSICRILKPTGFAFIMVPDLGSIADLIKNNLLGTLYESPGGPVAPIDMIYGNRAQVKSNQYMQHKTGFTLLSMSQVLAELDIKAVLASENNEISAILYKDVYPQFVNDREFKIRK